MKELAELFSYLEQMEREDLIFVELISNYRSKYAIQKKKAHFNLPAFYLGAYSQVFWFIRILEKIKNNLIIKKKKMAMINGCFK